ncbi:hypothetical protein LSH36_507g02047 [Paralvinella palmiformis]|uniref:Sodium-coupled monocarboxylate transporter 1 n=1 Tax=Paralvinella palmiformis TaxID=53620 RepID=A0AAD9J863_9ANNE|nr:hypothetical protein LSH36_507g02047 [Paralvinella palmiformis]
MDIKDYYEELAPLEPARFQTWDYVVFSIVLAISAGIGIYYALAGGKQRSQKEYLMANRSMSALPVALSVLASFFSASTLLGTPSEIYLEGTMYWLSVWGAILAPLVGAYVFGPFFFKLKVVSVFEYLEKRFHSKAIRLLGAILFLIRSVLGMGIVLYGPSTALNAVTGFPVWAGIVVVGIVCCFYTTLGGLKAVIWTDVFQTCIMLMGMLAVLIKGAIEVGGIGRAWDLASQSGRIEFFNFDPDPTVRHTFWTLIVGNFFVWLYPYTVDQQMIQRFSSTKSLEQAKLSLLLNIPGMFIIITLCSLAGLFMYAYYADCDPLLQGRATDPNQMSIAFNGAAGAPLVGIFIMACFFPWANWIGAFVGAIVGFAFTMWINIGAYVTDPSVTNNYNRSIEGCPMINVTYNVTTMMTFTDIEVSTSKSDTGYTKPHEIDPKYMMSYTNTFWPCLPKTARVKCWCGIDYDKVNDNDSISFSDSDDEKDKDLNIDGKISPFADDITNDEISTSTINMDTKQQTASINQINIDQLTKL